MSRLAPVSKRHAFSRGLLWLAAVLMAVSACGKKEPPRLPVSQRPPAPSGLTAIHREEGLILSWSYPGEGLSSLSGFMVMKSLDSGFTEKGRTDKLTFIDEEFGAGRTLRYKVVARSKDGMLSEGSNVVEAAFINTPSPPVDVSFRITPRGVRLSWCRPEDGVVFNVYRGAERGRYPLRPVNDAPVEGTGYTDGYTPPGAVYYTVRALRGGPLRHEGPPSEELAVTREDFVPSPVRGLEAVALERGMMLIWDESPERWVRGYRVYRAGEGRGFEPLGGTRTPAFTDHAPPRGRTLYIVNAVGPSVEGPPPGALEAGP